MTTTTNAEVENARKNLMAPIFIVVFGVVTMIAIILFVKPPLVESINLETQRMTAYGKAYGADEISWSRYPGTMHVSIDGKLMQCAKLSDEDFAAKLPIDCGNGRVLNAK